jgi:hypothetical protein
VGFMTVGAPARPRLCRDLTCRLVAVDDASDDAGAADLRSA